VGSRFVGNKEAFDFLKWHTSSQALKTNRWSPTNFPVHLVFEIEKSLMYFNMLNGFVT